MAARTFVCMAMVCHLLAFSSVYGIDLTQREAEFKSKVQPLIQKTCVGCHAGDEAEAGLAMNHFKTAKSILKERRTWEKIIQRVQLGEMPPKDAEPLSDSDRKFMIDWLNAMIQDVDCGKTPNPGAVTVRRLNRNEYRNTVRDLVGVDYDPASDFPGDDVGYGFDNIGDVLTLPPILMEKYLTAAETISQTAILAPEPGPLFEVSYRGDQLTSGSNSSRDNGSLLFFSNGSTDIMEQAPWTGAYSLELNLAATKAGSEPAKLRVSVDDKPVKEIAVTTALEDPKLYNLALKLKAGKRTIRLEFFNDHYIEGKNGAPAQDRNLYVLNFKLTGQKRADRIPPEKIPATHKAILREVPSTRVTVDAAARTVLQPLASRAFRRPAKKSELDRLVQLVSQTVDDGESFEGAIQLAIQALLVSPHFLFKIENLPSTKQIDAYPKISDFELATRLSYFLWSTMPDKGLFDLAIKNELSKPEVLVREVKRMVQDKRSDQFVENFAGQWLTLRKLDSIEPNKNLFPQWKPQTKELLKKETLLFFASVMRDDQSIQNLLDADYTFINQDLARFYAISGVEGSEFRKVSLQGHPRMGLLTQGSILAVTSNPTRTSPVKRGKFILDNLLGTPPPPAPAGVPELDKSELRGTLRERMEQHRNDPACASCHQLMDPLGFALENFDAVGQFRKNDPGGKIDASGVLPDGASVKHAGDLIRTLRSKHSEKFARCLTEKVMTYATGRGLEYYDRCSIDKIMSKLKQSDYRFSTLLSEIVLSDPFQRRGLREEL